MEKLSDYLGRENGRLYYWCHACDRMHSVSQLRWLWNGNAVKPTITPEVLHYVLQPGGHKEVVCHYSVAAGDLAYYPDCPHSRRGKTEKLQKLPNWAWS